MGHLQAHISGNNQDGYSVTNVDLGTNQVTEAYYFSSQAAAVKKYTQIIRENLKEQHQPHRQMRKMVE